jgi:hypothetical protein
MTRIRVSYGKSGPRLSVSQSWRVRQVTSWREARGRICLLILLGIFLVVCSHREWLMGMDPFLATGMMFAGGFVVFWFLRRRIRSFLYARDRLRRARQWNALRIHPVPDKDVLTLFDQ